MAVQQHVLNWLYSVLTSEYQDVNRTYNDVAQALAQFPSLSPRTDVHTFPDGVSALLLHLSGTLPAVFRGATYRYPVSVWVPHGYPREAPLVYVTPTETMMVRPGQHVDPQGQVYHPYLVGWSEFWDKSTLVDFLAILRDVFAKEPPVIARQPPPPPPAPTAVLSAPAPTPPPVPPLPQELASHPHSRPSSVANGGPAGAAHPPPPPPKPTRALTASTLSGTPSPPPVPPHPHPAGHQSVAGLVYDPRLGYAATHSSASPSPPPAALAGQHASRYDTAPPLPPQAAGASGGSGAAADRSGAPPVPGRPAAYQNSPLGQPPLSPNQHPLQHPYAAYPPSTSQQPPPPLPPHPSELANYDPRQSYYQYAQQQPQPQRYSYAQQEGLPPWQQQPAHQQLPQGPMQFHPVPIQPRAKAPVPDIMDETDADAGATSGSQDGPQTQRQPNQSQQLPPPVPPNPERDALLHALGRALAQARQQARAQNEATLPGLQAQRAAMLTAANRMQQDMSEVAQLSALVTSNSAILHETLVAADDVIARGKQTEPPAIDALLVGPTVVANQLYELVAEERALADAVFMLGRAVQHGRVSPAVFAKMTRSLAREWYLKKALVRKVARGMGLASA